MSKNRVPSLHRHATGMAFVRVRENGKPRDIYLGVFGSADARSRYSQFLAAYVAGERYEPAPRQRETESSGPTINELAVMYWNEITQRSKNVQNEAEQRLKVASGNLIDRNNHDRILLELIDSFVSGLETLPRRVVPLLRAARGHAEIDAILRDHIRTLRIQLAAKHSPTPAGERPAT